MTDMRGKTPWTEERKARHHYRMTHNNPHPKGKVVLGNRDENHWSWKGDDVGYAGIHNWIKRRRGLAKEHRCEHCENPAFDWANISREYKRDINDWMPLCRACHQVYDDIKARSWATRKAKSNA